MLELLVVDRYIARNQLLSQTQFCHDHLAGEATDLEKDFPDNQEVRAFVATVAPCFF